ncbi:MAG: hypothetical protein BGO14_00815 [Chlamydiales bacterium 38-26]|nr:MAG: hypothetical protein BGO14_00815 [Chlamydiales bacterium 38-26]
MGFRVVILASKKSGNEIGRILGNADGCILILFKELTVFVEKGHNIAILIMEGDVNLVVDF